jgi:hypothetical protein
MSAQAPTKDKPEQQPEPEQPEGDGQGEQQDEPGPAKPGEEAGLWPRLFYAQAIVRGPGKTGQNTDQNYTYVEHSQVVRVAKAALHEAGLIAFPAKGPTIAQIEQQTRSGGAAMMATYEGELTVLCPSSGEEANFPMVGAGRDTPGDKAIYKATSGALKYALGLALEIPFGDDPEDDSDGRQSQPIAATGTMPGWAHPAKPKDRERAINALRYLLAGGDRAKIEAIQPDHPRVARAIASTESMTGDEPILPAIAAAALIYAGAELRAARKARADAQQAAAEGQQAQQASGEPEQPPEAEDEAGPITNPPAEFDPRTQTMKPKGEAQPEPEARRQEPPAPPSDAAEDPIAEAERQAAEGQLDGVVYGDDSEDPDTRGIGF